MSNTIKETISLYDEVVSIVGEERPAEPAFENEDPEGWCNVLAWEEQASQALADLLMVERRKNQKLQAENAELKKQSKWISVDDELPEIGRTVEVWLQYERCYERAWRNQWSDGEVCWTFSNTVYDECSNEITHWKPLPTPPEGE